MPAGCSCGRRHDRRVAIGQMRERLRVFASWDVRRTNEGGRRKGRRRSQPRTDAMDSLLSEAECFASRSAMHPRTSPAFHDLPHLLLSIVPLPWVLADAPQCYRSRRCLHHGWV